MKSRLVFEDDAGEQWETEAEARVGDAKHELKHIFLDRYDCQVYTTDIVDTLTRDWEDVVRCMAVIHAKGLPPPGKP